jgi:hypothetical protein
MERFSQYLMTHSLAFLSSGVFDGVLFLHPVHVPLRERVHGVDAARHGAHEEVVVNVELLPLQHGRQ